MGCIVRVLAAAVLAVGLAGCGRDGALEPPPDPTVTAAAPPDQAATAGLPRRPKAVPIARPAEPFILDPLL